MDASVHTSVCKPLVRSSRYGTSPDKAFASIGSHKEQITVMQS